MVLSSRSAWGSVLTLFLVGTLAGGEAGPRPIVERGRGVLAVREAQGEPWRIVPEGAALPAECSLRTASAGPCRIRFAGCTLLAGSGTRLELRAEEQLVELAAGRIFLETEPSGAWAVELAECRVRLEGDTAAEVRLSREGECGASVLRGSVTATAEGGPATQVGAGQGVAWRRGEEGAADSAELSEAEVEQIGRWTDLNERPQGLGQLLVRDAQSGATNRLNIARYHVNVVLQPPVALVQIDQSFYNPYGRQEEGTFVFNLPLGASVSRFAMYVTPDQLVEGELIERERAADIYQTIVDRQRDPAILEQIGDNLFRMRVFPIFAKDTKRILLDYTLPLKREHGEYSFRLPLLSDLEPIWDFRLSGVVRGPTPGESFASFSHPDLRFRSRKDGSVDFDLEQQVFQPESDFHLRFEQRDEEEVRLRSQLAPPLPLPAGSAGEWSDPWSLRSATYFMASIPSRREASPTRPGPADVLILADTSSGLRGTRLVNDSLRTIVHNLGEEDCFRVMAVDVAARAIHEGWVEAGGPAAGSVLEKFGKEFCLGGTDLAAGFLEALQSFPEQTSQRRRVVIYVGDGEDAALSSTSAPIGVDELASKVEESGAAFAGVMVRRPADGRGVLDHLARSAGGLLFDLVGDPAGHGELFRWVLNGLPSPRKIESVHVDGAADEDLLFPTAWLPGERLDIFGRIPWSDNVRLKLRTSHEGRETVHDWKLEAKNDPEDIFVGRLWAQKKLDRLRRREASLGSGWNRQRIVALSQEWSLLSPHTAFLVLESERDYERWNVERRARRRYWKPVDALPRQPLPEGWLARVTPDESKRPREMEAKRVAEALKTAREAMAEENYGLALVVLQGVRGLSPARESEEFERLYRRATNGIGREGLLETLGPHRSLFDPAARSRWSQLDPHLGPVLMRPLGAGAAFLRRHPHAADLLADFPVRPRQGRQDGFSLRELAETLASVTGVNVVVDHAALADVGMSADSEWDVYGVGQMSLRNYARFVLSQAGLRMANLVMIDEPNRILLTTGEEAEEMLDLEIYPVADLYLEDRVPQPESLANPYLDRDLAAEARIRAKLDRRISVAFERTPLSWVVDHLAHVLDDTILIDQRALDDVGVPLSSPVTANWVAVPAREVLQWILEQEDLAYYLAGEAILITTPEEKESHMTTRLHSGRGIVFEYAVPESHAGISRPGTGSNLLRGFGGSLGGGMGGMGDGGYGGGMGGIGGFGAGGISSGPASGERLVLGLDPMLAAEAETLPTTEADEERDASPVEPEQVERVATEEHYDYDDDSVITQVTATVAPESWEDLGGRGSISFFAPTLDLVCRQTGEVHEQVEALFEQLRDLPTVWSEEEMRPARVRSGDANSSWDVNLAELISVITGTVSPYHWEDLGGPGSMAPDLPRLALAVRATQEVHEELFGLFTMLRRSRYEALRGERWWETAGGAVGGAVAGGKAFTALSADHGEADLPEADPRELEILRVRREGGGGLWRWRYTGTDEDRDEILELQVEKGRLRIARPEVEFRVAGGSAAIAYPELLLVEHGSWGEAVRQLADVWYPWMPHRSNRELARWFEVERSERETDVGPGLVFLRFRPHGIPEGAGTYLEAAFSQHDGTARVWESYADGKQTGRLRFGKPSHEAGQAFDQVILEDASGKRIARWELIAQEPEGPAMADLTDGWEGYVQWDRRSEQAAVDRAFARALEALHRFEWDRALAALAEAKDAHPQHPLLLLLGAWCETRRPGFDVRAGSLSVLREVAASRATGLTRFIDAGNFPGLEADVLYEILSEQPVSTRDGADLDRLAEVAMKAGKLEEALTHTEAALARGGSDASQFDRHVRQVELFLRMDRVDEVVATIEDWGTEATWTAERLAAMGELLAGFGQTATAEELFARALSREEMGQERRSALLVRLANLLVGKRRWMALVEAASLRPPDSDARQRYLNTVLTELDRTRQSEVAGELAEATDDPTIKAALRLRQAELAESSQVASRIVWEVYQSGRLDDARLGWACRQWNEGGDPKHTIEAVEERLRSGHAVADHVRSELEAAYRAAGRAVDAQRAATSDSRDVVD